MMPPLVDRHILALLQRLPGADGQSLATELAGAYLTAAPAGLDKVRDALATGDGALARRTAHSLRGSAALLGATAFSQMLYAIEARAEAGDLEAARDALRDADEAWPATAEALSATAASLRADSGAG